MSHFPLLLASKSPRRAELLNQIGVQFEVVSVSVEEVFGEGESPEAYVERLAMEKSAAGAALHSGRVVLGADTIVVCDGELMEKPADKTDCVRMLMKLSGSSHQVMTAVALTKDTEQAYCRSVSTVHFRELTESEAARYWDTGEPQDKAGAYGIQGFGAIFVANIEGSYSSIVGLPLFETQKLLKDFGISYWVTQ